MFPLLSNFSRRMITWFKIVSTDIVDGQLKLILALIWTLIIDYSIFVPVWADEDEGA